MDDRNLGKMGQCQLDNWCAAVGLTSNPSQEDNRGWDYFVEFPFVPDSNISADMQPSPIKCEIQVKSTDEIDRTKASVRNIKLSNLRHLATAPMPTFILFIEYKGLNSPNQAFLVHIDKILIEKILKRVRKADIEGKINKLHKMTLTINYDESHELPSLDGKGLKQAIEEYVGNMNSYVKNKLETIENIGFDSRNVHMTFNLNPKELPNFIEALLGFDKTIELNDFQSSLVRFGIKQPLSKKEEGKSFLSITKPPTYLGVIRFKTDKFSAGICFDAQMSIAPYYYMPKNSIAFRIRGDFFDITYIDYSDKNFGESKTKINWFFDVSMNIDKLKKLISLLTYISRNNFVIIELEKFDNLPSCPLECLTEMSDIGSFLDDVKEVVENTYQLAQYFELESELSVSLDYLMQKRDKINLLSKVITEDLTQKEIIVKSKDIFEISKNTAFITYISATLESYIIGIILGLSGVLESNEQEGYKFISDSSIIKKIAIPQEKLDSITHDFEFEIGKFISDNYHEEIQVIHNFNF